MSTPLFSCLRSPTFCVTYMSIVTRFVEKPTSDVETLTPSSTCFSRTLVTTPPKTFVGRVGSVWATSDPYWQLERGTTLCQRSIHPVYPKKVTRGCSATEGLIRDVDDLVLQTRREVRFHVYDGDVMDTQGLTNCPPLRNLVKESVKDLSYSFKPSSYRR